MISLTKVAATVVVVAWIGFAGSTPVLADDWKLSHGPFTTASDVTTHNKMPLDIKDVNDAIAAGEWEEAFARFGFGGNFANHSLARFADDYNGRLSSHVPTASAHFGTPSYQSHALVAALTENGRFRRVEPEARAAAAGYWLAAADALAEDAALTQSVEDALSGDADREKIAAAAEKISATN